jgi:hypothetical protein
MKAATGSAQEEEAEDLVGLLAGREDWWIPATEGEGRMEREERREGRVME